MHLFLLEKLSFSFEVSESTTSLPAETIVPVLLLASVKIRSAFFRSSSDLDLALISVFQIFFFPSFITSLALTFASAINFSVSS
jgi:hypothetical protein